MLPTIVFIVLAVAFFASLGRSAIPAAERRPLSRWGVKDLLAHVVRGGRRLIELDARNPLTPQRRLYLDDLDPRR